MKSLEELLKDGRQAVEPGDEVVARGRTRLLLRAGIAAGSASGVLTTTKAASALSTTVKTGSLWQLASAVALGLGGVGWYLAPSWPAETSAPAEIQPSASTGNSSSFSGSLPEALAAADAPEVPAHVADSAGSLTESPAAGRPSKKPQATASDPLQRDLHLLSEVNSALNAGQGNRALALLDSREVKTSAVSTEFLSLRAIALCQTGRTRTAEPLLVRLRTEHAQSPVLKRVEHACKGTTRAGPAP